MLSTAGWSDEHGSGAYSRKKVVAFHPVKSSLNAGSSA